MIAFYTVFLIFMSDAICITRFMVCFHQSWLFCRCNVSENNGT